jgi:hypothetical protein
MSDARQDWVWEFIADTRKKASIMRRARAAGHPWLRPEALTDHLEEFANDLEARLSSTLEGRRC